MSKVNNLIGSILTFAGTYIAGSVGRAVGEPLAYNLKFAYNIGGFRDKELATMKADQKYLEDQSIEEENRQLRKRLAELQNKAGKQKRK